jgi:hypothetical protein
VTQGLEISSFFGDGQNWKILSVKARYTTKLNQYNNLKYSNIYDYLASDSILPTAKKPSSGKSFSLRHLQGVGWGEQLPSASFQTGFRSYFCAE